MAINLHDIKNNFFMAYTKYWVVLIIIVIIYLMTSRTNYLFKRNNIVKDIPNTLYITNGIAINEKYILASNNIIETSCLGSLSGNPGSLFAISNYRIFPITIDRVDNYNNLVLLRLTQFSQRLEHFAILQSNVTNYSKNKKYIIPLTLNKANTFNFKKVKFLEEQNPNFFIVTKNINKIEDIIGNPVFNNNYILYGIIKEYNNHFSKSNSMLDKADIQKAYLVNGIKTIRTFLDDNKIEYSTINSNINLNNKGYLPKKSIVNIFCIKTY